MMIVKNTLNLRGINTPECLGRSHPLPAKVRQDPPQRLTPEEQPYTIMSTYKVDKRQRVEVGEMKWELDLWYELWDRAGSQGLDTWYDLRGEARDGPSPGHRLDAESQDTVQDRSSEGV
jgi:hypothetical protein